MSELVRPSSGAIISPAFLFELLLPIVTYNQTNRRRETFYTKEERSEATTGRERAKIQQNFMRFFVG